MGDRANVVIRDGSYKGGRELPDVASPEAVFLYGHWAGYDLPERLRKALSENEDRWTDAPYLARILHNAIGFDGISTRLTDNEYDLLVLLPDAKRLVRVPEQWYREHGLAGAGDHHPTISFEEYVTADERTWDNLTEVVQRA
jgi:hypothetical protein